MLPLCNMVLITNISPEVTETDLWGLFSYCGGKAVKEIDMSRYLVPKKTGLLHYHHMREPSLVATVTAFTYDFRASMSSFFFRHADPQLFSLQ